MEETREEEYEEECSCPRVALSEHWFVHMSISKMRSYIYMGEIRQSLVSTNTSKVLANTFRNTNSG